MRLNRVLNGVYRMMPWTLKYAPKTVDEIAGNDDAKAAVKKWALDWSRGKKQKPLLLYGPCGTGKTALAYALAGEMGWTIVESSSSDVRNEKSLQRRFGGGATTGLFGMRLLLIDDLDAVFDRGEVPALVELLSESTQPILLCANDFWTPNLAKIRVECAKAEFKKISKTTVKSVLKKIAAGEGLAVNAELDKRFEEIADYCSGDLRAAIIDFQSGTVSDREREEDVFKSLVSVFKGSFNDALKAEPEDLDFFLRWVEENIPAEYETPEDISRAFDAFSRADVFKGRIMKRQDYGMLKFVRAMGLGGVAAAKKTPYRKFSKYEFPSVIRMLSSSKRERGFLKAISSKMSDQLHCSPAEALETLLFVPEKIAHSAGGLSEDEQAFLKDWLKARRGK